MAADRQDGVAAKDYSFVLEHIDALVSSCEEAFGADEAAFRDDEDVSHPGTGITFGQIRMARKAVEAIRRG